jgi:hypothetical protein
MSEEEKIETFKETYNALYLQGVSDEKIRELKDTVNPVLLRLIDNLEVPKTYMVDYIEGPIKVTKLKLDIEGQSKKSFYLFGEYHKETRGECFPYSKKVSIDFSEYIKRLASTSPSFVDLYIELPMLRRSKPVLEGDLSHYDIVGNRTIITINNVINKMKSDQTIDFHDEFETEKYIINPDDTTSQMLDLVSEEFSRCIQPSSRNELDCQLMRIHNIDIRVSRFTEQINDDFYMKVMINILLQHDIDYMMKITLLRRIGQPMLKVLAKMICNGNFETSNFLGIALSNPDMRKELSKSYMVVKIIDFIKIKYQDTINSYLGGESIINELIIILLNDSCSVKNDMDYKLKSLGEFVLIMFSLSVDMYCLSRMFKKHKLNVSFQPEESKNIIAYAGLEHTNNYISFLKMIGAVETYNYESDNLKSCVKIVKTIPELDIRLIRFNLYIESLRKKLFKKISDNEISLNKAYPIVTIIQDGNIQADLLFESVKNNSISKSDFIRELDSLKVSLNERFENEIRI